MDIEALQMSILRMQDLRNAHANTAFATALVHDRTAHASSKYSNSPHANLVLAYSGRATFVMFEGIEGFTFVMFERVSIIQWGNVSIFQCFRVSTLSRVAAVGSACSPFHLFPQFT